MNNRYTTDEYVSMINAALEKALEIPVVRQGENRRVVGQEGRHHAQRSVLLGNPAFGFCKHIVKL